MQVCDHTHDGVIILPIGRHPPVAGKRSSPTPARSTMVKRDSARRRLQLLSCTTVNHLREARSRRDWMQHHLVDLADRETHHQLLQPGTARRCKVGKAKISSHSSAL
jgi:hypothetical protein